jgi:hypothetical protein
MKKIFHHLSHYLPLFGIIAAGILGFSLFSYDRAFQAVIVIASAASYVAWGLIHHYIHKDLHLSVIIEYFAYAVIGVTIVFSMLFRV